MESRQKNKIILLVFGILIILILLLALSGGSNDKATNNVTIQIKELDMDRYGLAFDNSLYGWIDTTDNESYYLTLNQFASLYYGSAETFEYPDGLIVSYHVQDNGGNGLKVVDKMYYVNGSEIPSVNNENETLFGANSPMIGANNPYCAEDFGLTAEESG